MSFNFFQVISLITAVLLFILVFVLGNHSKRGRTSTKILTLFLLSNALLLIQFIINGLAVIRFINFYFLLGPLLFLYTKTLCFSELKLQGLDLLHGIPFGLYMLVRICLDALRLRDPSIEWLITLSLHLQITAYLIASFRCISRCRTRLKDYYSSTETIDLSWLLVVILCFAAMWIMDLSNWILYSIRVNTPGIHDLLLFLSLAINFGFAVLIVYQGLKHADLFPVFSEKTKYEWSRLSHSEKEEYLKQLRRCMETDKPYLVPSLTIKDLSEKLTIPQRYLSQIINEFLNKNFYDFVNGYRIEEAKKYISLSATSKKTILEILYEVGFNSKSAFNLAFKQHTGRTPKEYKFHNPQLNEFEIRKGG
jgi:AraC-like DNA-binding protein